MAAWPGATSGNIRLDVVTILWVPRKREMQNDTEGYQHKKLKPQSWDL